MGNKTKITQEDIDLLNSEYSQIEDPELKYKLNGLLLSSPFFTIPYDELPLHVNEYPGFLIAWRLRIGK